MLSGECDSEVWQDRVKPVCNLRTGAFDSRSAAFRNDVLGPTVGQCFIQQALVQSGAITGSRLCRLPFADQPELPVDGDVRLLAKERYGDIRGRDRPVYLALCFRELQRPSLMPVLVGQLCGLVVQSCGICPSRKSVFSAFVLRCFGAATRVAPSFRPDIGR